MIPSKNKRHKSSNGTLKLKLKDEVNEDITHYESEPRDLKTFVERMMVLGYTYETVVDQTVLKYGVKRNLAEVQVKNIRASWVAYGQLDEPEKKAVLEQQLNHLFREALGKNELNIAAIAIKRKMELAGVATSNTGKGAVNCNVSIGNQGVTPEDILGADLTKERQDKIKAMELEIAAKKESKKKEQE